MSRCRGLCVAVPTSSTALLSQIMHGSPGRRGMSAVSKTQLAFEHGSSQWFSCLSSRHTIKEAGRGGNMRFSKRLLPINSPGPQLCRR